VIDDFTKRGDVVRMTFHPWHLYDFNLVMLIEYFPAVGTNYFLMRNAGIESMAARAALCTVMI